jgi:hypothetical protein
MTTPTWTKQLADGLIMRAAAPEDADRLADYNARMHRDPGTEIDAFWIGEWTRDLLTKPHPTTPPEDIIIVEDPANGEIVSSTAYFNQTWSYEGIPVPFGRPEIVSTHPDYRNRGLVRQQFDVMHEWGRQRGHLMQGITGIPYYYRQFGYEMALEMPVMKTARVDELPKWGDAEDRDVRLRLATRADLGFVSALHRASQSRALFSVEVSESEIGYQLFDRDRRSALSAQPHIIERANGEPAGFMLLKPVLPIEQAETRLVEFKDASACRELTTSTLKALRERLEALTDESGKRIKTLSAFISGTCPVHQHLDKNFHNFYPSARPYAWYIRVPDIARLLKTIAPALVKRLKGRPHEGLTGEFLVSYYRYGLNLKFESGMLTGIDHVQWPDRHLAAVRFPDLTFLQMVCGRKSFAELHEMFPDCSAKSGVEADLLDTLFPKRLSNTIFAMS